MRPELFIGLTPRGDSVQDGLIAPFKHFLSASSPRGAAGAIGIRATILGALLAGMLGSSIAAAAEPTLSMDLGEGVRLEMVLIPPGSFQQGSPADEAGREDDETMRRVTISEELYLGKFPVTRRQFTRFAAESGYRTEAEKGTSGGYGFDGQALVQRKEFAWRSPGFAQTDDDPVALVTYDDALAFTAWLSRKAGRSVVLPTEAQWEHACRAGTQSPYPSGSDLQAALAIGWFKNNAGNGTRPVGQKQPNAWGLFDLSGNVFEWCRDWYGPYEPGAVTDPEQTRSDLSDKPRRVLRGGSWFKDAADARCAARYRNTPGSRNADNGFRVAAGAAMSTGAVPDMPAEADASRAAASAPVSSSDTSSPRAAHPSPFFRNFDRIFNVLVGMFSLFFAFVLYRILRGAKSIVAPRETAPAAQGLPVRPAADGFWIEAPESFRGRSARIRYSANFTRHDKVIQLEPGATGHFVYTGAEPLDVIAELFEAPIHPLAETPPTPERHRTTEPEPFRGYPSAY